MMLGELDAANGFLHKAIRLAHQSHNNDAIIYTYSLVDLLLDLVQSHITSLVYQNVPVVILASFSTDGQLGFCSR